ncbi:DUF349 domain-containing protein [Polaribacter aestuariivivens]|uniref:DUF349 domain-containing protein n=1 Tax=Polaribacter aestuariivivens TaxID=2304626 RepID=A0A5S3N154_9FLAO|nr:DUF349 domain-containing protein [Polaribacter aestuariivivens]TMM29041.1 DUF349 domain-containing protein [Polaribacter aestuariivivens]
MLDKNDENVEKTVTNTEEAVNIAPETVKENTEEILQKETEKPKLQDENTSEKEVVVNENEEDTTEAVDEIEKSVAENSENGDSNDEDETEVDYSKLTLEELVSDLKKTISNNPVQKIKNKVEVIKSAFNKKFGDLLAKKKKAFIDAGGNSIDFQFSSPIKTEYNTLLSNYKKERDAYYQDLEKQLKANLEKRLQVIEDLKDLIENADTETMYKQFKDLQDTWRAIGPVSKTRYNDTWKTYHHHVERFYDLLHLSNDFRDLDFRNNLEEKLKIIEQAQALAKEPDINFAFKELQELHKKWKEDIGPVAREMREEIWHKFSSATKKIHDRRHQYFREMRSKYDEIIEKKLKVIAVLNEYDTSNNQSHNDWQKSIKEVEALRQEYFNAGKLPYNKSEDVWQKFKAATKKFNAAKNLFYKQEKSEQQKNLEKKLALIDIAESLKESEDWETATNTMKKIQSDWKKIGHVPRKFSDDIWKRFKAACNFYFDRFHKQKNTVSKEQQEVVKAKKAFLEDLKAKENHTKESILASIEKWKELGSLPRNSRHLEGKFNKQIDKMLETLSLDKQEISMLKFTNVVDGYYANKDFKKLDSEQLFVRKKMDEIVREMQQLENNLGFFSNANDKNPLVVNVKNQIEDFKTDLEIWKEKLDYLKKLEY